MRLTKLFISTWILGWTLCSGSVLAQTTQPGSVEFAQASQQLDDGIAAYKQRNFDQALIHFKASLLSGNQHQRATAYGNIGLVLLVKGHFEESIEAFNESIRLENDHALAYGNRGIAFERLNRFQEALADYNMSLKLKPDDPLFLSFRADYYFHRLNLDAALADYQKLVVLKPDNALYFNRLGQILYEKYNYEASLVPLNQAIALKPLYFDAILNRAMVLGEIGYVEESLNDFFRASGIKPKSGLLFTLRAMVMLKQGRFDDAWKDLQTAQEVEPGLEITHAALSHYWLAMRKPDKAKHEAELAIKISPGFANGYYLMGESLAQQNNYEQAIKFYDEAINLNNSHPDFLLGRAHALLRLEKEKEALIEIEKVSNKLAKASLRAQYEDFWSKYYGFHRRWHEAFPHASEAVRLSPLSGTYQFTLGEILRELGKEKLAETAYQKSCQLGFSDGCRRIGVGTP